MTTALSNSRNLRRQEPPRTDVFYAAYMYLSAKKDNDEFRIEAAGRHLEFLRDMQILGGSVAGKSGRFGERG